MMNIHSSPLLRQALVADATTSAAFGLMMLIGAGPLSGVFGLPETLLRIAGLVLLPYAAFIGWLGLRETIGKPVAWAVVLGNGLWVLDSILLLASGWVSPTPRCGSPLRAACATSSPRSTMEARRTWS